MPNETRVQLRLSEKEKRDWEAAARREGADSLSGWIRMLIRSRLMRLARRAKR